MSSRKRSKVKQDKAQYLLDKLYSSGMLKEGNVYDITVLHDDGCNIFQGVECNCSPTLQIMDTTLEASWDLSKLPKGLRAKEGDISVIRPVSNSVN